ncbi:hypothetical protein [Acuticoccus sp. I52.16.1]|uniref:hypothetical protein n=1 Tax=Acuticoccus sp. I52.16.1 TaxID=2928472 RepID=UPI001FD326BC|nr:hypothetical protein [Acuticoccus sp. I52.16.1]UOM33193.1 hypothetical protein MRB58_15135 [Acuticoccus sp. I52.16.1]
MRVASFGGALAAVLLASTSVVAQSAANDTTSAICEPTAGTACEPAAPATERPAATRPTADDPAYRGFGEPRFDPSSADGAPPLEPILTRVETPAFAPARSGAIAGEAQLSSQATDGRPSEVESVVSDAPEAEAETVPAAEVGVTRVTLATGGLAQVEGRMNGAADTMRLAIERPQVADVLRTLVITGAAPVVSIDLEAAEPVGQRSATGRLLAGDLSNPTTILEALIGAEVTVSGGPRQLSGRLLAFTPVVVPGSESTPETPGLRVSVATPDGQIAYAVFPSLEQLSVTGNAVAERMAALVPALAESVDDGRRDLTVRLAEAAEAGFSFVVPTTVWRPSYRALVGAGGEVSLQGWATLENTTGLDWNGIDLRLAVGTPVAYAQDVYAPLRTTRPRAPFEVGRTAEVDPVPSEEAAVDAPPRFASLAAPAPMVSRGRSGAKLADEVAAELVTGGPALAGSASTLFPVAGSIDLAAGRTLTVPFLSADQDVARIVFFDLVAGTQPFDALEMSFDADATVPGGLVAVYDADGFVGDARFAGADGGEVSILPFAVSADVKTSTQERNTQNLTSASLRDGSLIIRREQIGETVLSVAAGEDVTLVTDIGRLGGDTITAEAEGLDPEVVNIDAGRARLRVDLTQGRHTIRIVARKPLTERYVLGNLPPYVLEEVLSAGGSIDAETRARLEEIRDVTARIAEIDRRVAALEEEIETMRRAVEFERDNLEAIDPSTPDGAQVRSRIIQRTAEIDGWMREISDLRRQRLDEFAVLQGTDAPQ